MSKIQDISSNRIDMVLKAPFPAVAAVLTTSELRRKWRMGPADFDQVFYGLDLRDGGYEETHMLARNTPLHRWRFDFVHFVSPTEWSSTLQCWVEDELVTLSLLNTRASPHENGTRWENTETLHIYNTIYSSEQRHDLLTWMANQLDALAQWHWSGKASQGTDDG